MTSASSSGDLRAERLHPELVVLPVAARLRAFVPEHGAVVVELHRLGQSVHAVLDVSSGHGRGAFRTKGHAPAAQVFEGVHLLADDVRGLPHAPGEKTGLLEGGRVDAAVAVPAEDLLRRTITQRRTACCSGRMSYVPLGA